jgi:hypothetical protein
MHEPIEYELEPDEREQNSFSQHPLKPRSKKIAGAASGAAIGSVIPVLGPLLGALIGYTVADSPWVENKVDNLLDKTNK